MSFLPHILNGLQLGMLLFLLAVGLTLIFGLMGVLNLAHGAFYTLGAYLGLLFHQRTGSFWLSLVVATILSFSIGVVFERLVIRPLQLRRRSDLEIALLTFGFMFVVMGGVELLFGVQYASITLPLVLSGSVRLFGMDYPTYRLFIIATGTLIAGVLWLVLEKTIVGAVLRGGVDNRAMIEGLGINISTLFTITFGVGIALAGFAGTIAAPMLSIYSHMGMSILIPALIVIVIGGLGNFKGSFFASIAVGITETIASAYSEGTQLFAIYILLVILILYRTAGRVALVGETK